MKYRRYSFDVAALLVGRSRDRSPVLSLEIFFHGSFRQNHVAWGRLSLWKWVLGISSGVKAAGAFGWRPTTLVVLKVEKIRCLNLPGTPMATSTCRGIPLLYFTLLLHLWYSWMFEEIVNSTRAAILRYIIVNIYNCRATNTILTIVHIIVGHAVAQLVEALRYNPEGRGFDSRCCHWNFSLT